MNILSIRSLRGPNVYAHRPVLVMRLDLEALAGKETREVPGFNDALMALLPGLADHRCSRRRTGGFVEKLWEGTYFGHVVEHVALELSELAGIPAYFGKALSTDIPGTFDIVTEYVNEQAMRGLLRIACELTQALTVGNQFGLQEHLAEARALAHRSELGPSTRAVVEAAERRGFPWRMVSEEMSLIEVGWGCHMRRIQAAMSDRTSAIGVDIASDKELTKKILADVMIPVPVGKIVSSHDEARAAFREIVPPVAVKPLNANQAKGVTLNVPTEAAVTEAFDCAAKYSSPVMIEEMIQGNDYRVLVVGGKVIAAAQRRPAQVTGDGVHTLRELIELTNRDPNRGEGHTKPLTLLAINETVVKNLAAAGLTPDAVPEPGRQVLLQQAANLSTGGTAADVTELVHPDIVHTCERASRIIGLDICGVDLVLRDITRPMDRSNGSIIEINASPGLRMHVHPSHGRSRAVGDAIVEMLYPRGAPARIPIVSVTGTNGKTTVTRMIGHILSHAGRHVGVTTTDEMHIRGTVVARGDLTGAQSARTVLSDPAVDIAVLETARGGIVRSGLGYDWSDVSVITTIQPDHIGQDGIHTVDDIFHIKSLVAERVREGGTLILNLDDERVAGIADLPRVRDPHRNVVYYTLTGSREDVQRCSRGNGTGYYLKDGWIVEVKGFRQHLVAHVSAIPAAFNGLAQFNVSNAMAAIAATRALGFRASIIAAGLQEFSAIQSNPGRANLFRVNKGYILLDYGHNAEAIGAIAHMATAADCPRVTGIIGVPGDRADSLIEEAGRVAGRGFQRVIIREDADLRGRRTGEVPAILRDAIRMAAPGRECLIIPDVCQALGRALLDMVDDELIVVFYEQLEPVLGLLHLHGAIPAQSINARQRVTVKTAI
jgi:cyanophycin synthetase